MFFKRFRPDHDLEPFIECYWIVEDDDTTPRLQKIVPDGFNEIIFHLGDPYRIRLYDHWEQQSTSLLAGHIRKHFFLENTGSSNIVGIKLKPTALTHLFGLHMYQFTDKVVDLTSSLVSILATASNSGKQMIIMQKLPCWTITLKDYYRWYRFKKQGQTAL
jgi:hypothetical protein